MDQIASFFENIFNPADIPPLKECGVWTNFHGSLYTISNLLISLCCFMIPLVIIRYIIRQDKISFRPVYFLFAAFILASGTIYLVDAAIFWVPVYRFGTLVRLATAIISLLTVFYLSRMLRQKEDIRYKRESEAEINLIETEEELKQKNILLQIQNERLNEIAWMGSHKLRGPVASILGLSKLFNHDNYGDPDNAKIVEGIYIATKDMDNIVKELVAKASSRGTEYGTDQTGD